MSDVVHKGDNVCYCSDGITEEKHKLVHTINGSPGDFSQEGRYVRPWSLNILFCRTGFGLVVSVVVPYAGGVAICERSRVRLPV
jgi:hypothetical protein